MPRDVTSYKLYPQIQAQPAELARLLTADEPVVEAAALLGKAQRVFCCGIGTAYNAARAAVWMLQAAGVNAVGSPSADLVLYGPPLDAARDALLAFSHTGNKSASREVLAKGAELGIPTVWVAGIEAKANPATVTLRTVTPETTAPYTVSHTTSMLLAARVADAIRPGSVGDLNAVPAAVEAALGLEAQARELAERWQGVGAIIGIGAGPQEVTAHELGVKIDEAAWMRCYAYGVEPFFHGPQAQLQTGDALTCFATPGPGMARTREVAQFGLDVGAPVAWVAPVDGPEGATAFRVQDVGDYLATIVQTVPAQLLAAHLAAFRDIDADRFRLDDPPFAEAFKKYQL